MEKIKVTEKGYKDGLVARLKNQYSGKKYTVSTAQEIGKDYWSIVVAPTEFFGLWFNWSKRHTFIRNKKDDAYDIHRQVKKIVETTQETEWLELFPKPSPSEGYSEDAKRTIEKKLGIRI